MQYSMFFNACFIGIQLAFSKTCAVISDDRCLCDSMEGLCNIRPDCSVVSSTSLEQNRCAATFHDVKMETIASDVDEDVRLLRTGRICQSCEAEKQREQKGFHRRACTVRSA